METYKFPAPSFADLGAQILVGVIRAGAAVMWVSSLDGDGVVGQLTISQCPCHRTWHRHHPLFAVLGLPFSIGIIRVVTWQWAELMVTWQWAELMVVDTSSRPITDVVECQRW